jgi:hypothetical protein
MIESDPNGWETCAEDRFTHQYFDDTDLIKNMVFDLDVCSNWCLKISSFIPLVSSMLPYTGY